MFVSFPNKIPILRDAPLSLFGPSPGMVPIAKLPDLWYLDSPLIWTQPGLTITIPAGFITDDASIPKILDWIPFLDRQGLSRRPGLLHDGLYSLGRSKGKDWCDRILAVACAEEGMSAWQCEAYYQGVHLFGNSSWAADAGKFGKITSGDFYTDEYFEAFSKVGTIYS